MYFRHIRSFILGAALFPLAHADVPPPDAPPPYAQALGIYESALKYCGPVDAESAAKLRERIKLLVQDASEDQLTKARDSDAYRKAYDSMEEFVSKVDERNAKHMCSESALAEHK
jgi:hypothetical protein